MKNLRILLIAVLGLFFSATSFSQSSQPDLNSYVATFKMAENEYCKKIIIALKEGKLIGSTDVNPADGVVLIPTKEADKFTTTIQGNDAEITFSRVDGNVSAIKLSAAGGQVVLTGEIEIPSAISMADYPATYKMADNPYVKEVKIALKEGKLLLSSDANPSESVEIAPTMKADIFTASIQGNDAEIVFTRAEDKVVKIKISVGGGQVVLTGDKELAVAASMADYVATFKMADNPYVKEIIITLKEGKIFLSTDANPSDGTALTPGKNADTFTASLQGNETEITFTRTESKVTKITINVGDGQFVLSGDKK